MKHFATIISAFFLLYSYSSQAQEQAPKTANRQNEDYSVYNDWKARSKDRTVDTVPLNDALATAGGSNLDVNSFWPALPKRLLILQSGADAKAYRQNFESGLPSKWAAAFSTWCKGVGGIAGTRGKREVVWDFVISKLAVPSIEHFLKNNTDVLVCIDRIAWNSLDIEDPILQITLVHGFPSKSRREVEYDKPQMFLIAQTRQDVLETRSLLNKMAAEEAEQERNKARTEEDRVASLWSEWNVSSKKLRDRIKAGDSALVLVKRHDDWSRAPEFSPFEGLVIEVKKPLVQLQFTNFEPRIQWVKIDDVFSTQIPPRFRCSRRENVRQTCIK